MNAKPGPDASAYDSTDSPKDVARNPIVANTAKPANTPVKQSHETTIHICLLDRRQEIERDRMKMDHSHLKNLFSNRLAAE